MTAITREYLDALVQRVERFGPVTDDTLPLAAALRRVLDLHHECTASDGEQRCHADLMPWPCATVRILAGTQTDVPTYIGGRNGGAGAPRLAGTQTDGGAGGSTPAVSSGGESASGQQSPAPAPSSPDRIEVVARAMCAYFGVFVRPMDHEAAADIIAALDAYDREHVASLDPADYVEVIWRDDEDRRCHTFVSRFVKAQIEADLRERIAAWVREHCVSEGHSGGDGVCARCARIAGRTARGQS